jgi:heptosyltransferase I
MRILIVKLSSMGDILHTFPALTECLTYFPQIEFDWVVEPQFKELLSWHAGIRNVYTLPLRAARKNFKLFFTEIPQVLNKLRAQQYDLVIDAQGLIKSALLAKLVKAKRVVGLDKYSSRESLARFAYHQDYAVPWSLHAVHRVKNLFSQIFGYKASGDIHYGIQQNKLLDIHSTLDLPKQKFFIFLHGTTWPTKHWPEQYWQELIGLVCAYYPERHIYLPWGSLEEKRRAKRLAANYTQVKVLPKLSITELAGYIIQAQAIVAVDTGLGHLSAALGIKTINLYGPTDPKRTGTIGANQVHLTSRPMYSCSPCLKRQCVYVKQDYPPCYKKLLPEMILENLIS